MRRTLLTIGTAIGALVAPSVASAATTVLALGNSSQAIPAPTVTGTGASTGLSLTLGQQVSIWTDSTAIWASGAIPLWSTAAGQVGDLFSTAATAGVTGTTAGDLIGSATPALTIGTFTAPVGSLVGEIGGNYQLIGTGYEGTAWGTGTLNLFFWDQYSADNVGSLSVQAAIPEPATWALMMAGFGILGFGLRRRTATASRVSFNFA